MITPFKRWFQNQKNHFFSLSKTERRLLLSFFLFAVASPMTGTYTATFLWRLNQDPKVLILYTLAVYATLSLGFLFNGLLLRYTETAVLYLVGCVIQGLVPLSIIFLGSDSLPTVFLFGALYGLAAGFFWANRNYLTSKLTKTTHRFFFLSTDNALSTMAGIAAPITIGWFLVLGERSHLYSLDTAYHIAAGVGLIILFVAGWTVMKAPLPECINPIKHLFFKHAPAAWNRLRAMEVCNGFIDGVESIVPLVMVLTFLGAEETIGTIDSLSAVAAAILIYTLGKRLGRGHQFTLLVIWVVASMIGSGGFALLYSGLGVIIYYVINALVNLVRFTSLSSIMYEAIDDHLGEGAAHRYVYIMDREFFLNGGRVLSLSLLFIGFTFVPSFTLRFSLLIILAAEGLLLFIVKPLTKRTKEPALPPLVPSEPMPAIEATETLVP